MATCYLCGVENQHSYDCPKFITFSIQPAVLVEVELTKPIATANFRSSVDNKMWDIGVVLKGNMIPKWVTHGWYLRPGGTVISLHSREELMLEELANAWGATNSIPWALKSRHYIAGTIWTEPSKLAVFKMS